MADKITSENIKKCIYEHENILKQLEEISRMAEQYKKNIQNASYELINEETTKILKNIPVDELNRDKRGFRIKTLKDYGYNTVADIVKATPSRLANINGISPEAAYSILGIAEEIKKDAQKNVKVKISSDNRTSSITKLVDSVSAYLNSTELSTECSLFLVQNRREIESNIEALKPATNFFKRIFMSKFKRRMTNDAYRLLQEKLDGEYNKKSKQLIQKKENIKSIDSGWDYFNNNSVKFFNVLEKVSPEFVAGSDGVYGLPDEKAKEIKAVRIRKEGLKCELRTYQEWGVKYILHYGKVLLGDEMGLGKTVQAIAAMVSLRNTGATRFLVVCPASVLTNWCREIGKMSDLNVIKIHGADRMSSIKEWTDNGGVGVTTYETTAYMNNIDKNIDMIVVDEAHYIKNNKAKRSCNTRALCSLSVNILLMTGTPLENKLDEMISLIEVLKPEMALKLSEKHTFIDAPKFREQIVSVYYRRKRDDVLRELPELIEEEDWCTMTSDDKRAYIEALNFGSYADIRRVSWNVNDINKSSKAQRLIDIISEAKEEGRKVIVFSFFLDTLRIISNLVKDNCYTSITGALSPEQRQNVIDEFEKGPSGSVLPLQINAGGTGLNIQSASVVVICEPQFKPSIENQAISRAYRMGQTRNVIVHRLLCEDTIDEPMMKRLASKQQIFDNYADKSEAAQETAEFSEKSFELIVEREKQRIGLKMSE